MLLSVGVPTSMARDSQNRLIAMLMGVARSLMTSTSTPAALIPSMMGIVMCSVLCHMVS